MVFVVVIGPHCVTGGGQDTQWREGTVRNRENNLVKTWAGYAEK